MKLSVIITALIYASSNAAYAAADDEHNGIAIVGRIIPRHESDDHDHGHGHDHSNIEDFETMLLSTNTHPATCTHNCRCPLSNPSCTLSACTSNCKCQSGGCSMPKCTTNCKCQSGGCDMPKCTKNCKCQAGSCPMPVCKRQCKCTLGGCFSSEQEEFLLAMGQHDVGAPAAPYHIAPKHVARLRGAKHVMSSGAELDHSYESLTSLANSYRMTAQALLKTADLAMDLSTLEDLSSLEVAKNQVLRAAQVAQSLGGDAEDEAEEVFGSMLSIQHKASSPSTEKMFYYSTAKAVQKSNRATHKAEQKTHQATTKAENKTHQATSKAEHKSQQAVNKADRKTKSAIQKANYKTASALAKAEASAGSSCFDAASALDHAAELTASAISIGAAAKVDAAKLASYEASHAVTVANDSLTYAAEVAINALN